MNDLTKRVIIIYNYLEAEKKVKSSTDFAKQINVSSSMINEISKERSNAGINVVQNIVKYFEFINSEWLLTGKGEMLKKEQEVSEGKIELLERNIVLLEENSKLKDMQIKYLKEEIAELKEQLRVKIFGRKNTEMGTDALKKIIDRKK